MPLIAGHIVIFQWRGLRIYKVLDLIVVMLVFFGDSPQVSPEPFSLAYLNICLSALFHADLTFQALFAAWVPYVFRCHWLGTEYLKPIIDIFRHTARGQKFSYFLFSNFQVKLLELFLIIAIAPGVNSCVTHREEGGHGCCCCCQRASCSLGRGSYRCSPRCCRQTEPN